VTKDDDVTERVPRLGIGGGATGDSITASVLVAMRLYADVLVCDLHI